MIYGRFVELFSSALNLNVPPATQLTYIAVAVVVPDNKACADAAVDPIAGIPAESDIVSDGELLLLTFTVAAVVQWNMMDCRFATVNGVEMSTFDALASSANSWFSSVSDVTVACPATVSPPAS